MSVRVRLFAAAAETVGATEVRSEAGTVTELISELTARGGPEVEKVLGRCSILVDGRRAAPTQPLTGQATVDVLPPFAGG